MKPSLQSIKQCGAGAGRVPCSMGFITAARAWRSCLLPRQPCAHLASVGGVGRAVFGCLWAVVTRVERVPFYSWLGYVSLARDG